MENTFEIFHKSVRKGLKNEAGVPQLGFLGHHDLVLRVRPEGGHQTSLQAGPDLVGQVEDCSLLKKLSGFLGYFKDLTVETSPG